MSRFCLLLIVLSALFVAIQCVDRSKFRTCEQTGFCRRHRHKVGSSNGEGYKLDVSTVKMQDDGSLIGKIKVPHVDNMNDDMLNLNIQLVTGGAVRIKIYEDGDRWAPTSLLQPPTNTLLALTLLPPGSNKLPSDLQSLSATQLIALSFNADRSLVVIYPETMKIVMYVDGNIEMIANSNNLLHYEMKGGVNMRRLDDSQSTEQADDEDRHAGKEVVDYGEDGLAIYADGSREERRLDATSSHSNDKIEGDNFGGHKDTMLMGPMSVGVDFDFPHAQNVYGIPEHATSLSLPTTKAGNTNINPKYHEPFRMYNLDVFEYELDNPMSLYGQIPMMLAHGINDGKGITSGVFWFNPTETFIDISDHKPDDQQDDTNFHKATHWISESGNIDFFWLPGPDVNSIYHQYSLITGTQQLPPLFSLGYHQCRWNYRDEKDVAQVEAMFEELDYPMDVIWLDIEHTDGKRYFTWDKNVFPNPIEMQKNITKHGRRMVTIVDPHIKRDHNYHTHKEATALGYYIKNKDGGDFDGWCWPGSSSYLDFTSEKVRLWWQQQFSLSKYIGSTLDLFTWNDMNEPSVFNGPEVSMPKDAKNLEGIEHREWHNLYGTFMQMATALGLQQREVPQGQEQQRPFVLSRAFWAGTQRWGAIWTGDNTASWGHLKSSSPMLLSINLAGLSFAGADVGGFFGNPDAELFTRFYQAGAFMPFFRGHAHLDTKRREPWVFGEPYTSILRHAAMIRYSLLPFWYTVFYQSYKTGMPVMRTMWQEFPDDAHSLELQDQWMIGSSLLVAPVIDRGATHVQVYLPRSHASATDEKWYNFYTLETISSNSPGITTRVDAPMDTIPVFLRSGSIIGRKMRLRRSSKLMHMDPYTLVIAPSTTNEATGYIYMDDEITLAHETKEMYAYMALNFKDNMLTIQKLGGSTAYLPDNTIERIEIAGQTKAPSRVVLMVEGDNAVDLVHFYDSDANKVTIKKPDVKMAATGWSIMLEF